MPRPLMQQGVTQLEQLFAQSKSDPTVLKQLEHELQYRQVPRAIALLADVQAALYGGANAAPVAAPAVAVPASASFPLRQSDLWPIPVDRAGSAECVRQSTPPDRLPEAAPVKAPAAVPAMPLEEACKVLKTTLGASWDSIEKRRQTLVEQSNPLGSQTFSAGKRAQLLEEARRVNAAYMTLLHTKHGGRYEASSR